MSLGGGGGLHIGSPDELSAGPADTNVVHKVIQSKTKIIFDMTKLIG